MLPILMAAGGGLAAAGLAGAYASGAMGSRRVAAPQWGGSPDALAREQQQLQGYEGQGRALAMSARADQAALASRYGDLEAGRGPSLAREQLREGANTAANNATNLAASVRGGGGNQLLAMRQAQNVGAQQAAAANSAAAQVRAQEQIGAMNAQAALYQGMRSADQQAYQQDLAARHGITGQQMEMDRWATDTNSRLEEANRQRKAALWGGLSSAGGSMLSMGLGGK